MEFVEACPDAQINGALVDIGAASAYYFTFFALAVVADAFLALARPWEMIIRAFFPFLYMGNES